MTVREKIMAFIAGATHVFFFYSRSKTGRSHTDIVVSSSDKIHHLTESILSFIQTLPSFVRSLYWNWLGGERSSELTGDCISCIPVTCRASLAHHQQQTQPGGSVNTLATLQRNISTQLSAQQYYSISVYCDNDLDDFIFLAQLLQLKEYENKLFPS